MSLSDLEDVQIFVVVDIRILCKLNTMLNSFNRYLHAIFVLLATQYTFNITEFSVGITPKKKPQNCA